MRYDDATCPDSLAIPLCVLTSLILKIDCKLRNPSHNWLEYRRQLTKLTEEHKPVVPYLPLLLRDIRLLDEGNMSEIGSMLNVDKLRTMAKLLNVSRTCLMLESIVESSHG